MGQTEISGALTVTRLSCGLTEALAQWIAPRGLVVSCVLAMTMAGGALAGDNPTPPPAAAPPPSVGELLRKIENQLLAGHLISPANDNAMGTWQEVLDREVVNPTEPEIVHALAAFAAEAKAHAAEEEAAGHSLLATEFNVFAEQAGRLANEGQTGPAGGENAQATAVETTPADRTGPAPAAPEPAATASAAPAPAAPAPVAPEPAAPEPAAPAPAAIASAAPAPAAPEPAAEVAPVVAAMAMPTASQTPATDPADETAGPPTVVAGRDPAGEARPADAVPEPVSLTEPAAAIDPAGQASHGGTPAPAAASASGTTDPRMIEFYIRRGDDMLAHKDISAARKFYQFAAEAGSSHAAMALAKTYDAAFIGRLGVIGLRPDPAQAALWYRRAAEAGDQQAAALLDRRPTEAAK